MNEYENEDNFDPEKPTPPFMPPNPPKKPYPDDIVNKKVTLKNVTIRGIETEIYDEFSHSMKILGMNIGDAITKMMQDVLEDFDDEFPDISAKSLRSKRLDESTIMQHDRLSVSKKDLEEANRRFQFLNVEVLTIEPDVTKEVFMKYIKQIISCEKVRIPSTLPKLIIYSKIMNCDSVEIYDVDDEDEVDQKETVE